MKGYHLGELEELILLTVGILNQEAYGVSIWKKSKSNCPKRQYFRDSHRIKSLEKRFSSIQNGWSDRGARWQEKAPFYTFSYWEEQQSSK